MDANVNILLDKAARAEEAHHAMQFSQAALNAAHTLEVLAAIERWQAEINGTLVGPEKV
jgi:hypothetical protein